MPHLLLPRLKMRFGLVHAMQSNGPHYKSTNPSCDWQFCSHGPLPPFVFFLEQQSKQTPPEVILSGKLFARSFFFLLRKPFLDCWTRSLLCQQPYALCNCFAWWHSLALCCILLFNWSSIFLSCNNCVATNTTTSTTTRMTKERQASRRRGRSNVHW
jgi:hypothetical protein